MFAVLMAPDFALQAALRETPHPPERPVALLEEAPTRNRGKTPLLQVNRAARRAGVTPGMTATQAQARRADIALLYRRPLAEARAEAALSRVAADFTPDHESTAPGVATLDLFRLWRAQLTNDLPTRLLTAAREATELEWRVGLAANPDLARLAACLADPALTLADDPAAARAFLAPLPTRALAPSPEARTLFHLWGVRTLGDVMKLAREDLTRRLGTEGGDLWDAAHGRRSRPLRLVRPPATYRAVWEFEQGVETLEPLLFLLRRLLDILAARLAAHWLLAGALRLTLNFDNGTAHHRELRLAEASGDAGLLLRVLRSHLETITAAAPIVSLALEAAPAPPGRCQRQFFDASLRDPNQFAETLARLEALLGRDRVGSPDSPPTHRPDAIAMRAGLALGDGAPAALVPPAFPLRRFRPPLPARVWLENQRLARLETSLFQAHIVDQRGPWLLSGNWWDAGRWSVAEWDIAWEGGALGRLAKRGSGWTLEGVYG